jgi:hypothetical protein
MLATDLTLDEETTIRHVLHDWGLQDAYFYADYDKVEALKKKLEIDS